MRVKRIHLLVLSLSLAIPGFLSATPANVWHIPDNLEINNGATHMRDPWVEISNDPNNPTTVTIYQGIYKGNGSNQTGGTLFFKGSSQGVWTSIPLSFYSNVNSNQYWRASFSTGGNSNSANGPTYAAIPANDIIQYYIFVTTDGSAGFGDTFIYAPAGFGDHGGQTVQGEVFSGSPQQDTAASNPFTIRNRPGWIFHANNRVNSGNDVQFWTKLGYIGNVNDLSTRWATNGALYYTTDGTDPAPGASPGTVVPGSTTQVAAFSYDHPDNNATQNGGSTSIAGTAMWWVATGPNLLASQLGTTVKYKVGFWNSSNNEQKFGDYNAGDGTNYQGHIFSFSIGTVGDPVLTVTSPTNGTLNANYTTSHVFVDETHGDSIPFTFVFQPGQANVTQVELYTNLNRRDNATIPYTDANGISTEEGIEPINGDNVQAGDDTHYFKAYTMPADSNPGEYSLTLNATKTGAYRATARWKVSGDNSWRYYTNIAAGRRDHAIVVSPVIARNINLYEVNVFNIEGSDTSFANRGTLEDLYDAPNAPHQGASNHWNLNYLKNLGCNWMWFQPVHPITEEAQQGHTPGSPYSVRNFFDIDPLMSTNYSGSPTDPAALNSASNRNAAKQAFQGLVTAANNAGVGVMLDAPFNHTAPDCEISVAGTPYFGNNPSPTALFRDTEARFYSRDPDNTGPQPPNYAMRAFSSTSIAIAPDRGDFGKWSDVRDVYFGRYAALVDTNGDGGTPNDNGNYLNEQDWFDYSIGNEGSSGSGNGHFDQVTQNVWKYFSNYTLYWLDQTGVPAGTNLANQTSKGIGGLRADFGQGLPPQLWEYIINKTRSRKWNFVFMAESLDGGAVTYRSNRHFDLLNENIVFPLKNASSTSDFRGIFDQRRSSYGQSLVLLNNTSHDEEQYSDPWYAVIRYAVCSTIDGAPLIFPGQELGISTNFGYNLYETNFGKNIVDFKDFNSMTPAWNDTNFGNDQLYPVYAGIGLAREFSPALRSSNRYYLNQTDGSIQQSLFSVAKYEAANGSPATTDVVFGFANLNRDADQVGNFNVNIAQNGSNLFGIKRGRTYDFRNIAAYLGFDSNRRNYFLNRKTGDQLLDNGLFVAMNKVPTMATSANPSDPAWNQRPYEAQYLKLYDVTAPSTTPGVAVTPNQYSYELVTAQNNTGTISWTAAAPDSEGVVPCYKVSVTINGNTTSSIVCGTSTTISGAPGQVATVVIQAVNPNDNSVLGPASSPVTIHFIDPNADDDGDGMTNGAEDIAGTNPLDANSLLRMTNVSAPSNGNVTVTWTSVPGKTYQVQGATTPSGNAFVDIPSTVTTAAPNTTTTTISVPAVNGPFYRVRVVP